jgi:septum site-determining protein MinD
MTQVLAINAFRSGTGSTHIAANLAMLLAQAGRRVGLIDGDIQGPSQHFLFNLPEEQKVGSLYDFLHGGSTLREVPIYVPPQPGRDSEAKESGSNGHSDGQPEPRYLYLVPSETITPSSRVRVVASYDVGRLRQALNDFAERLALDILVVDTPAGLGTATMTILALCDQLLAVLTLDRREVHGSSITVGVARELEVPETKIVINKAPAGYDPDTIGRQVAISCGCEVVAILPYADEIASLESGGLFTQRYPGHPATWSMHKLLHSILATA